MENLSGTKINGIILCTILLFASSKAQAQKIIQFAESPWPPYVVGEPDESARAEGTAVDLVRRVFARIDGVEPRFQMLPWKRVLSDVEYGKKDAISFLQYTPERAEYLDFTDPLMSSESVFFYSKRKYPKGVSWRKLDDLTGFQIGIVADYAQSTRLDEAKAHGIALDIQKIVGTDDQLFSMLQKQRIDLFVCNIEVGEEIIRQHGWQNEIGRVDLPIQSVKFYMAFSKRNQHTALIKKVNKVLTELRNERLILLNRATSSVND